MLDTEYSVIKSDVIKSFDCIYDNAKSCVKAGENMSTFLVACQVFVKVIICHYFCSRCF